MCSYCYDELDTLKINQINCGLCKVSIVDPSRNRLAENVIKNLLVKCKFDECNAIMKYSSMDRHLHFECPAFHVKCKYKLLGCSWKGPRRNVNNHQHQGISYDDLVKKLADAEFQIMKMQEFEDALEKFQNIIYHHHIIGVFDLRSIWKDFDIQQSIDSQCVFRICYNHDKKSRIRIQLIFSIAHDKDQFFFGCRLNAESFNGEAKKINASICYAEGENDDFSQNEMTPLIMFGDVSHQEPFTSQLVKLIFFDLDIENLEQANVSIQKCKHLGNVKVFVQLE